MAEIDKGESLYSKSTFNIRLTFYVFEHRKASRIERLSYTGGFSMQSAFTNWFAWNGAGVMAAYFKEYYPSGDLRCKEAPGRFFLLQGVLRTSFDNLYRISGTWIREICHVSYISPLFQNLPAV